MSVLPYSKDILVAWAAAYLSSGGRQDKARQSLLSRGQPWHDILGDAGTKPSTWKPKVSRLTAAARDAGALPKLPVPKQVATPASRATDLTTGQVLLPGVIRDCMHASEVLEILSQVARGTHPKQQDIKPEASLRFSLDAIGQLVKVLGIEPPEKTGMDDPMAAKSRLRARLSKLPPAVLDQLREVVGEEEEL